MPYSPPPSAGLEPRSNVMGIWILLLGLPFKRNKGTAKYLGCSLTLRALKFQITDIQLQSAPELRDSPILCVPLSPQSMDERLRFSAHYTYAWERGKWDLEGSLAGLHRLWSQPLGCKKLPTCCVSHRSALKKVNHVFSSHLLVSYKLWQNIS